MKTSFNKHRHVFLNARASDFDWNLKYRSENVKKTIFSLLNCFGTFVEKSIDNKYNGLSLDSQPSTTDPLLHQLHTVLITV